VAHCSNIFVADAVNGASAMEARAAGASSPIGGPSIADRKLLKIASNSDIGREIQ